MRIDGVDWNLEMGSVAEMIYHAKPDNPPALLFENIPGYPADMKVLSGATNSPRRLALTLGLPEARATRSMSSSPTASGLETFDDHPAARRQRRVRSSITSTGTTRSICSNSRSRSSTSRMAGAISAPGIW